MVFVITHQFVYIWVNSGVYDGIYQSPKEISVTSLHSLSPFHIINKFLIIYFSFKDMHRFQRKMETYYFLAQTKLNVKVSKHYYYNNYCHIINCNDGILLQQCFSHYISYVFTLFVFIMVI